MGLFSWLRGEKKEAEKNSTDANDREAGERDAASDDDGAGENEEGETRLSVEELTAMLESKSGAARCDGARGLLDRWRYLDLAAAAVLAPRVEAMLEDDEAVVRQCALAAVRMMRKPENLTRVQSAVLAALNDPAAPVRTAAIWAAAHLPGEVPRAQVRAQLASEEEPMRFGAACALADRQDASCLPVLARSLAFEHLRQEALSAMMACGDGAALEAIGKLFESETLGAFDRTLAAAALARFDDARGRAYLIERIEQSSDDRPVAAEWAGRLRVKEAAEALFALADEVGDAARGAALRALGRLHADGAWEKLRSFAADSEVSEDLRMDAAEGIAELGTPQSRALLQELTAAAGELGQLCRELLAELAVADARAEALQSAASAETATHAAAAASSPAAEPNLPAAETSKPPG